VADPVQDAEPVRRPVAATAVITDARSGSSEELSRRVRRYTITMAFRTACFVSMIFVPGTLRWVLFGCAVFLPYVAVVLANQSDQRTRTSRIERGGPATAPQLGAGGSPGPGDGEVLEGSVEDEREDHVG
jgi:hypothetical protein